MEINELRKEKGLKYRVTAMKLTGKEFAATIQIRNDLSPLEHNLCWSVAETLREVATTLFNKAVMNDESCT
jgi:hypothetical protein